jgi:hypothetical protein
MNSNEYRKATQDWISQYANTDWTGWYSVSLTMRQSRRELSETSSGSFKFELDEIQASQNMRHFLTRLNKKIYGAAFTRYNKCVDVVPVFEYDKSNKLHYHLLIKVPNRISEYQLHALILTNWMKTNWGLWEMDLQNTHDSGWLRYITKETTQDFTNIDVPNLTLND